MAKQLYRVLRSAMLYSPSHSFDVDFFYFLDIGPVQMGHRNAIMRMLTVLCIDDEALGLQVRRAVLERAGYQVLTATDGKTGVSIFKQNCIDAVLLDYLMPEMDGGEVAIIIRDLKPEVPILLHSACVDLPREVLNLVDATLAKGDGAETLIHRLRQVIEEAKPPSENTR